MVLDLKASKKLINKEKKINRLQAYQYFENIKTKKVE
jgi:ribosomal protein S21